MNLNVTGRLEDLAPGERIYSARFMGERCYLVTFKKIDQLFEISPEDPADPHVLGKLKIHRYSNYLHPYSENLLIGIGKETVEAEDRSMLKSGYYFYSEYSVNRALYIEDFLYTLSEQRKDQQLGNAPRD
jgi:uncharacterized secreted protein with C-terminal beta-propeller domain